jgi:hypothetical protein
LAVLLVLSSFIYAKMPGWQVLSFFLFVLLTYLVYRYARVVSQVLETTCLPFTSEEIWQFLAENEIQYYEMWEGKEPDNLISQGFVVGICQFSMEGTKKTPADAYFYMAGRGAEKIIIGRFVCERKI